MEHEGKFVKTKQEIKQTITEYYKKLDNDNDLEAQNFNNMFPLDQKTNQRQKSYQIMNQYNMCKKKMLIMQSKIRRKIRQVVWTTQQPNASNTFQTT